MTLPVPPTWQWDVAGAETLADAIKRLAAKASSDFGEFSSPQEEQEQAWRKAAYRLIGLAAPQLALTHASRFAAPDPSTMVDQAALKLQTLAGKKGAGSTSASLFLEDWAKYLVSKGDTSGVIFPVARSDVEEMASSFSTSG